MVTNFLTNTRTEQSSTFCTFQSHRFSLFILFRETRSRNIQRYSSWLVWICKCGEAENGKPIDVEIRQSTRVETPQPEGSQDAHKISV